MATKKAGKVAIVYSENENSSSESKNLAHYLCGLLSASGFAQIYMLPYNASGPISDLTSNRRIIFYPPNSSKPMEVPSADVSYSHWSVLPECHLVVATVNPDDADSCGTKLAETLQNHKSRIPVFSIQRGVKYGTSLSDEIESKGITVIDAIIGFGVVIEPKHSAYVPTSSAPSIIFQRLSKEEVKIADQPLRLLETMQLDVSFRKFLTPHAWGLFLYEHLHVVNMLTKGSLSDTLSKREHRLLYALLVRESIEILSAASKGGQWKPDLLLASSLLRPKWLELMLVLPAPLFSLGFWFFGLFPREGVISPGQFDLMENRKTMAVFNLREVVDVARRNKVACPLTELVLSVLQRVESAQEARVGSKAYSSYHSSDLLQEIAHQIPELYPTHDSLLELRYWLVRIAAAAALVVLFVFLCYHE